MRQMVSQKGLTFIACWLVLVGCSAACQRKQGMPAPSATSSTEIVRPLIYKPLPPNSSPEVRKFIDAAVAQVGVTTGYDPSYVRLEYPGGDVPKETGVCSDVIIRAFRGVDIDLQKEIHEDMNRAWAEYPKRWGLNRPDRNIDHRRVPNLMTYFKRIGKAVALSNNSDDYQPGDIVTWDLGGGIDHIGIATDRALSPNGPLLIAHNVGAGARVEDVLFRWQITGHYRYF